MEKASAIVKHYETRLLFHLLPFLRRPQVEGYEVRRFVTAERSCAHRVLACCPP